MKKIIAAIFTVFFTLPVFGIIERRSIGRQVIVPVDSSLSGGTSNVSATTPTQRVSSEASDPKPAPTVNTTELPSTTAAELAPENAPGIIAPQPTPEAITPQELPTKQSEKSGKNIFQKAGDGIAKGAKAVGKGVTNAWNATSNFVSGIFKGAEPCSDNADKALKDKVQCPAGKCTGSLVEKTKLDTKQTGVKEGKEENGEPKAGKCVIAKCIKGWIVNDTKDGCEQSEGDCTDKAKEMHQKATAGELKKGKCQITECEYGWHASDDAQTCEQAELSEADSKQKVADLKDNAQKMKDKEQSTANKLLGGAAIGATGIGAMNLASGLAEQKADSAAEEDMKAYLATFVCDYGQGRNIKGGETNIDLPGGNDLFADVNEYRALAADLKIRKEALGKQPGIESEVIIDAADTGLYDNVGLGRQSGAYTSLSRALTDETSKDAEEWAKQKADTASKVKTGAITAGAGAIGGMIGNLAINSGEKNKNKVNEIISNYDKKKQAVQTLQTKIDKAPENTPKCSDYTYNNTILVGTYPDCECGDKAYFKPDYSDNGKLVGCISCLGDTIPNKEKTQCVCANGHEPDEKGICPPDNAPCNLKGNFVDTENCKCITGAVPANTDNTACICDTDGHYYDAGNNQCTYCDPASHTLKDGNCTPNSEGTQLGPIIINSSSFFDTGSAKLKNESFMSDLSTQLNDIQDTSGQYNVCITGQTDPSGGYKLNKELSTARAYTIFTTIKNANSIKPFKSIEYKGTGQVTAEDPSDSIYEGKRCLPKTKSTWDKCRRVLITITTNDCGEGFSDTETPPQNYNKYNK